MITSKTVYPTSVGTAGIITRTKRTPEESQKRLYELIRKHPQIDRATHLQDLELCKKYLNGDRIPFDTMFQIAYKKLERYVNKHCGKHIGVSINEQDREDLIADVSTTAIEKMDMFGGWSLFSTWMIAIARYRIIDLINKRCKEKKNLSDDEYDDSRSVSPMYQQRDEISVWEILSCLPKIDAAIVRLKAVEEYSFSVIAKHLNLSTKETQQRYNESIKILRNVLQDKTPNK